MATAGSAIGLGSLWKFPYVTGANGGGLFILAYLLFTFFVGVPIFIAEVMIGRAAQRCPVGTFADLAKSKKGWRIVGWSCALATFFVLAFYSVVSGWALNYAFMSLLGFMQGKDAEQIRGVFDTLYHAGGLNLLLTALFLGITVGIVYRGIRKGIEFWSKILTPALLVILVGLFFYSMTLEGFGEAFRFTFYPDPSKLKPSGLIQALGLACFTLSVGLGILITYGSYMQRDADIPKTAFTIASIDILVSLLASLMIFPIIFSFGFSPEEGPGLLFKTMPVLFSKLPGGLLISTVFFFLVVFAALTSTISVMEVLTATASEMFGWTRHRASLIMGGLVFLLAIPCALAGSGALFGNWSAMYGKNFFDTIDDLTFSYMLPINAVLIAIFAGWVLEKALRREEFSAGTRMGYLLFPWVWLLRYVVPVGVGIIFLQEANLIDIDRLLERL